MKIVTKVLTISALAMSAALPVTGIAQSAMDHSKMNMPQMAASMTDGEVKKSRS